VGTPSRDDAATQAAAREGGTTSPETRKVESAE
jgi:hypothetical protein